MALARKGDYLGAVKKYEELFELVTRGRLTHRELHVCYANHASCLIKLGNWTRALESAEKSFSTSVEKISE